MKKTKRTDLACERTASESALYRTEVKIKGGIDCIYSRGKHDGIIDSITLYTGRIWRYNTDFFNSAVNTLSECIWEIIHEHSRECTNILTVCLGNRSITVDSIGPRVGDRLIPTKHLKGFKINTGIIITGVEGQSGFTSFDGIKAYLSIWKPDIILVIDSLCSRGTERLLTTVQLSSVGIMPGSGVGNHKNELSQFTLGMPVISIGVPTISQYFRSKYEKTPAGVSEFYISSMESDIGVDTFAILISKAIEKMYYIAK